MPVTTANKPLGLNACFNSWTEKYKPSVLRTVMEDGTVHTRRVTTALDSEITASVACKAADAELWKTWYKTSQCGVLPIKVQGPDGKDTVVRFTAPPSISYSGANNVTCEISFDFEHLNAWDTP
jgi:hypothetical protein